MSDSIELLPHIQALEIRLHQRATRSDAGIVNKLLHRDFVEIGRSGQRYTRLQTVSALATERTAEIVARDFTLAMIAEGVALLTYKSFQSDVADVISKQTLRSSIWVLEEGHWQMRFHQGTAAAD